MKYFAILIVSLLLGVSANCQHQLYFESFNGATNTFTINDTGLGINKGNNKWIIDTNYFSGGIYPNTTNESITYGGSITGFPYSKYLHIYDSASTYLDDNYNPNDSSTRFAHMTSGICTKSLTNINFNFYYLCPTVSSYGTVWYSIDGGAWVSTGDTLRNRQKWQYATVTNPVFTNVEDLRFGFLWHNAKATSTKDTNSLGIDDISMYGIYDSVAHPIKCSFFNYYIDSCIGNSPVAFFSATLTDSTCDATWYAYMSKPNGSFPGNGDGWYQPVGQAYYNDITQYWYLVLPVNFNTVGCYKYMLQRSGYPSLTFIDSICIPFDSCPGTIQTLQPPATLDTNPVCAGSIMDIPFWSTGIYDPTNNYFGLLIDSNTITHTAKIDTVGYLPSNIAYPASAFPPAPGDIVGTIPLTVPPGCNYYVEVVCNTGNRRPTPWGPFCIQHCDIKTNNQQSVQGVCLESCYRQPHGYTDTITYNDSMSHYYFGNKFEAQLISFMLYPPSFGAINTGLFGIKVDSAEGHFKLLIHVPCPDTLFANGINPGVYYLRIIADSSNFPDSSLGSLVQLTIGEPADSMYLTYTTFPAGIIPPYCVGDQFIFYANPNDGVPPYNSTYAWWYWDRANGRQAEPPNFNQSQIALTANIADTFVISCQETNFGCNGTIAYSDTIVVLGPPPVTKTGPTTLCLNDTGVYSIPFEGTTNYIWRVPAGSHADTSTNVLKISFNTTGTFKIIAKAVNYCFSDSTFWIVTVVDKPVPTITANPPSTTICDGTSEALSVSAIGATSYLWENGNRTTSITVTPNSDTSYWVQVSNRGCSVKDTVKFTVLPKPIINVMACVGDSVVLHASGATTYTWLPSTGLTINDSIAKGIIPFIETFTVIGTSNGCSDTINVPINPSSTTDTISKTLVANAGQSVQLVAEGGKSWLWSPSASLNNDTLENPVATPSVTTIYTVVIRNGNGCIVIDTVTVDVDVTCDVWVPQIFSPSDPNGHNTILYVRSECAVSIDFTVFDRWGNKVFESQDINKGWDGTYEGKALNPGSFVYYVTGKTLDGKPLTRKGNVTLVR